MGENIVRQLVFIVGGLFLFSLCAIAEEIKEDYVIGEQDILSINVWKEPELSVKELVVRPDGKISLPLVNDIQASGLTSKQLREQIAEKLKEFVASPNVSVTVNKTFSHTVSVVGQVSRPGVYSISSPTTVLDLLARVGGLAESANAKKIRILRNDKGKIQQFPFDYTKAIKDRICSVISSLKTAIPF